MGLIPEIDRLLAIDEENIGKIRAFLSEFSPQLLESINEAAVLHTTVNRVFGQGLADHFQEVVDSMRAFGVETIGELENELSKSPSASKEEVSAQAIGALHRYYDRQNRGILLARIGVLYSLAMTDLLRVRVTGPLGYIRVQCESVALMRLMRENPAVAREWWEIKNEAQGKKFFHTHQANVKTTLAGFNLEFAYDNASSAALHSRFAGISLGLEVTTEVVGDRMAQNIRVKAQELDPDNPDLFLLVVLHVLRVQQRIFSSLAATSPEIGDPLFLETRVPAFASSIDALYALMGSRRPDLLASYQQEGGAL